jgi:putative heme-binding domain-containing protein
VLRKLWGEHGLDEDLLGVLGRVPRTGDREKFVAGLGSARLATLRTCLAALERLGPPAGKEGLRDEAFALVRALRQLGTAKEEERLRQRLVARLRRVSGEMWAKADDWLAWLKKGWPELAARLDDPDGVDVPGWQKRLGRIDWGNGDEKRGAAVYVKASCAACHGGSAALGPDLHGVAGRFSRDDLFTAILRPSKDVSPRYRTTQLATAKGQVYQGIIVYEAADSVILLTGPAQTVRLAHQQVSDRRLTATSLMPAGLLDRLGDGEVSDLYAYLKSLKGK